MNITDAAYRHERLAPGAFQEPETMHLHVDLGGNLDVLRELRNQLLQFGATPKEDFIIESDLSATPPSGILSLPANLDDELVSHLRLILRHLHDVDVRPCGTELERVIAQIDTKGVTRIAGADHLFQCEFIDADFVEELPGLIELHHSVKIPKRTTKPPISLSQLATRSKDLGSLTWSIFQNPDTWSYRSTVLIRTDARAFIRSGELAAVLQRDYARLPSVFKDVASGARYSMIAEEVVARWSYPLKPSEQNRNKWSFIRMTGVSDRGLPSFDDVLAQCRRAPAKKLLVRDARGKARIASNLEGFQRIVKAQGCEPILMELGLIPADAGSEYFGSQIITSAGSEYDAEAVLEAWRNQNWLVLQSGYSPVMSNPETWRNLFFWVTARPLVSEKTKPVSSERITAAGEQLFSLTPVRQYRRVENTVIGLFHGTILTAPESFRALNAGLLAVPFEGERCRGCLFVMVSAANLGERRIRDLAACLSIMLHRAALKKASAPAPVAPPAEAEVRPRSDRRVQQAKEHDALWTAIENVTSEQAGTRIERIAIEYPDAFALFDQYPHLKSLHADIEQAGKITDVIEMAWKIMSGTEARRLFEWRKKAGIPPRKHA